MPIVTSFRRLYNSMLPVGAAHANMIDGMAFEVYLLRAHTAGSC